jgi:transposase
MNPETWGHIHYLFTIEKLPKKVIARSLGLSPKTIRRTLKKKTFQTAGKPRASKLDPFKDKISALRADYPGLSGLRFLEEIRKLGYPGGISILREHLALLPKPPRVFLHIQTAPAEEAQVDWTFAGTIGSQRIVAFLLVLSYSSLLFVKFFPAQSLEYFLAGHLQAFHFLQGVPKKIRYDNLKSVVLGRFGPAVQFNARFLDFARYYCFDPSLCNPKQPHEKGRVERAARYLKENFLAGRSFVSLTDINQQVARWLEQEANCRIHGSTRQKPVERFQAEQSLLTPLPPQDYDTRLITTVKSTSQALVTFQTNRYSVPATYALRLLTLKADDQFVYLYDPDRLIAQHPRSYLKYQLLENPRHRQPLLPARPQGAYFKHRDLILALGQPAPAYFQTLAQTQLHWPAQVKKVIRLIDLYGKTEVLAAMDQALDHHALGYDYLNNIILANRRKRSAPPISGILSSKVNPELIRSTWVEERDPALYDHIFDPAEDPDEHGND